MLDRPYIPQSGFPELVMHRLGFFSYSILYAPMSKHVYGVVSMNELTN